MCHGKWRYPGNSEDMQQGVDEGHAPQFPFSDFGRSFWWRIMIVVKDGQGYRGCILQMP